MQIIITFMSNNGKGDFHVNSNMKIKDALEIINKNSELKIQSPNFVFSSRKQEQVSSQCTFQDARIYSGDCLKVEGE